MIPKLYRLFNKFCNGLPNQPLKPIAVHLAAPADFFGKAPLNSAGIECKLFGAADIKACQCLNFIFQAKFAADTCGKIAVKINNPVSTVRQRLVPFSGQVISKGSAKAADTISKKNHHQFFH